MKDQHLKQIREKFIKYAKTAKIPGFTAGIVAGDSIAQFSGGISQPDNDPVNQDTLFAIGSLSKPLTAVLYAVLHEKGIIQYTKSLRFYLEKRYRVHSIFDHLTIADVLTHHSGLPRLPSGLFSRMENTSDPYAALTREDFAQFLEAPEELNKPGKYVYSNIGYMLLGEILKVILERTYDEIAEEYLLKDASMTRTGTLNKFKSDINKATGYDQRNRIAADWTGELLDGAGSIYSTNQDMLAFLQLHLQEGDSTFLKAVQSTQEIVKGSMGLGWHHRTGWLSRLLGYSGFSWHNGMTGGFSSFLAFHKKKRTGMFVLANKATSIDHWFYYYSSFTR